MTKAALLQDAMSEGFNEINVEKNDRTENASQLWEVGFKARETCGEHPVLEDNNVAVYDPKSQSRTPTSVDNALASV